MGRKVVCSSVQRILPHQVVRAYLRKKIAPTFGRFKRMVNEEVCGCALAAMFLSKIDIEELRPHWVADACLASAKSRGYSDVYLNFFMLGFDGNFMYGDNNSPEALQGYADGEAARRLVELKLNAGILKKVDI